MSRYGVPIAISVVLAAAARSAPPLESASPLPLPRLSGPPVIDGDLSEWKSLAFTDGLWDLPRVRRAPWYDPEINRLTLHGAESGEDDDLQSRYYVAWDDEYLYFGAEVKDNVNDVADPAHAPDRWYFKDAIAWFIEAPADDKPESFGEGDHAFCFVIDETKPDYGMWWRHGSKSKAYIEETLPRPTAERAIRFSKRNEGRGDFVLEARVRVKDTLGKGDSAWRSPREGERYRLQIVHTDPDGGGYGGHLLIYGKGDDDSTWSEAVLTGPRHVEARRPE